MKYIVKIEKDGSGFMASFPDVPGALTGGDTREETLRLAQDALVTAISGYMDQRKAVPAPTRAPRKGDDVVYLPELTEAKALLWNAMLAAKVNKSELARRLKKTEGYVRRLLDPHENVTVNSLAEAAQALHMRIEMELVPA